MTVYIFTKEQLEELLDKQKDKCSEFLVGLAYERVIDTQYPDLPEPVTVPSVATIKANMDVSNCADDFTEVYIEGANFVLTNLNLKK